MYNFILKNQNLSRVLMAWTQTPLQISIKTSNAFLSFSPPLSITFSKANVIDVSHSVKPQKALVQQVRPNEKGEENLVTVINVYCPRADPDKPERADFKLSFYKLLRQRASAIKESGSFVVIVGDLNTSHKQIDHCDPCDDEIP
ncbi:DNA-(apurinic or apyrimidinic site) lyase 2 [Armadillidium vulgare]|nr:DNA-(apurinic or apyrimidinic site) lyase 2 [Armadillidium vulgare]